MKACPNCASVGNDVYCPDCRKRGEVVLMLDQRGLAVALDGLRKKAHWIKEAQKALEKQDLL